MNTIFTCIIVDDENDSIELLSGRINILFKNITISATCNSWTEALDTLKNKRCDLLFMDISMPEKNGIDLLKLIPSIDCEIIFVTAHDNYALSAFTVKASGYVLKPINDTDLTSAVNIALQRVKNKATDNSDIILPQEPHLGKIGISDKEGIDYLNVSEILYLESINKCTRIITGTRSYITSLSIGNYKPLTSQSAFFQVHRAYIINLNYVKRYRATGVVVMTNGQEIPVSRNVKVDFLKSINHTF